MGSVVGLHPMVGLVAEKDEDLLRVETSDSESDVKDVELQLGLQLAAALFLAARLFV